MNISDEMKEKAVSLGLCAKWTAEWEDNSSVDVILEKYIRGIDFCIKHDFPSLDIMKTQIDAVHAHGIYVDEAVRLRNPKIVVLRGHCDASILFDTFAVATVYVCNASRLSVIVNGNAIVRICLHSHGSVDATVAGLGKCTVYNYGDATSIKGNARVLDRTEFAKKHFVKE